MCTVLRLTETSTNPVQNEVTLFKPYKSKSMLCIRCGCKPLHNSCLGDRGNRWHREEATHGDLTRMKLIEISRKAHQWDIIIIIIITCGMTWCRMCLFHLNIETKFGKVNNLLPCLHRLEYFGETLMKLVYIIWF